MPFARLLPCPFCGKGATVKRAVIGTAEGHRVECEHCRATGPFTVESELIARLYWNQRYIGDKVARVSRNDPQSINKAVLSGLEIWSKNQITGLWERVRAARSTDGRIQVRTERLDWMPLIEMLVGTDPNLVPDQKE